MGVSSLASALLVGLFGIAFCKRQKIEQLIQTEGMREDAARQSTTCDWGNGTEEKDLPYGDDECSGQSCQVYDWYPTLAAEGPVPVPLAIFVHGGAWQGGSKCSIPAQLRDMRQRGWHVASINYRLSAPLSGGGGGNYASFPEHAEDVERAVLHFKSKAAEHNLDAERIVLLGGSAGGHLVSFIGTYRPRRIAAVVNFYGPTMLNVENDDKIENFLECAGNAEEGTPCYQKAVRASPYTNVSEGSAPFLTFFGLKDKGYAAAPLFQAKGDDVGADFTLYEVECNNHGHCHDRQTMLSAMSVTESGMKCNADIMYDWMADQVSWHNSGCSLSSCTRRDGQYCR